MVMVISNRLLQLREGAGSETKPVYIRQGTLEGGSVVRAAKCKGVREGSLEWLAVILISIGKRLRLLFIDIFSNQNPLSTDMVDSVKP